MKDTPAQLEMEDEDTTDVFQQQRGGVYSKGSLLLYSRAAPPGQEAICNEKTAVWFHHILLTTV